MQEVSNDQVEMLVGLGTAATTEQIKNLLRKHNGAMDIVASALLDGNFQSNTPPMTEEERGRTATKTAPALPPRRKNPSPVDNSMALVRTDQPPAYDEDAALNEALAMSMNDQGPPPLEPALPEYGPFQDPKKYENRHLDSGTDHALRQALEASLNDGKNSLAADVYAERIPVERARAADGRPTALRSSDQNTIFAPPVFQALMAIPQVRARLKESHSRFMPEGDEAAKQTLEGAWTDCQLTRDLLSHAECTQQAYIDIKQWTGDGPGTLGSAHSPANAATDLLGRLTRNLNLSLPSPFTPLFLANLHDPSSATPPPTSPLLPHLEATQPHPDTIHYVVPLNMDTAPSNYLVDILESQVSHDRVGFISPLPDALAFKVLRKDASGKFEFPARIWFDRWTLEKRDLVDNVVKAREKEIDEGIKQSEDESLRLRKCEGRDTVADLQVCIKHFEHTASDGGDPKRRARNEQTLEKLKIILKDLEFRVAELTKTVEDLRAERLQLWNMPDLMTVPYDLQAVLVHDGLLGRAHIYSYVRRGDKWWKIVDSDVTEVTEATVLNDSSGVHLGAGIFALIYAKPFKDEETKWPRKERIKSQKLDEEFRSTLPPAVRPQFEKTAPTISPAESDEDEFMDAEEHITVEHDVVDEVHDLPGETIQKDRPDMDKDGDMQSVRGDETDKPESQNMREVD